MENEKRLDKNMRMASLYLKYGMFVILAAIFIVSALLSNNFIKVSNLLTILRTMSATGIAALGMTFILILGHIDLSVGSVMAFAGCVACIITRDTGMVLLAIFVAILIGAGIGLLNGAVVTKFGIPAFIMTLATQYVARGLALLSTGGFPVNHMGEAFKILGQGAIFGVLPVPIVIMAVLMIVGWIVLNKTKFGRYVFASGGNPSAAKASGVNVNGTVIKAFIMHGCLSGLAGVLLMSRMNSGQPSGATNYEFYAITAAVVGGTSLSGGIGNILGTFIGALIVAIIDNIMLLKGIDVYWQYIIKGIVIALAVIADFKTRSILQKS